MKNQNFGLSKEKFDEMVCLLQQRDSSLYESIFLPKFKQCMGFLKNRYKAQHHDAYDVCMDATIEFRTRLIAGKVSYGNTKFLYNKIASQLYQKKMKEFKSAELEESHMKQESQVLDEEDIQVMRKTWYELSETCRILLSKHLYFDVKLVDIAKDENKTSSSVRKAKRRCMNKLLTLFSKNSKSEVYGTFSPII